MWNRNSSLVRSPDSQTNLTIAMARVVKESDFVYGKSSDRQTQTDRQTAVS
jgi:hypothetical protein